MKMIIIAAMLLSLMPIAVEAQGTDTGFIMSRFTSLKVMTAHS